MKICTKCKTLKANSTFYKRPTRRGNIQSRCKECLSEDHKKYYQARKAETIKQHKKYYETTVGHLRHCFQAIKQRCNNSKHRAYKWYGARGIKVKFKNADDFINHIINELQVNTQNLTIDRINNDGHYERGNIRFITQAENNRNKSRRTNGNR